MNHHTSSPGSHSHIHTSLKQLTCPTHFRWRGPEARDNRRASPWHLPCSPAGMSRWSARTPAGATPQNRALALASTSRNSADARTSRCIPYSPRAPQRSPPEPSYKGPPWPQHAISSIQLRCAPRGHLERAGTRAAPLGGGLRSQPGCTPPFGVRRACCCRETWLLSVDRHRARPGEKNIDHEPLVPRRGS